MADKNKKVTLVLPSYNEEGNIARVINQVKPYCDELLVVAAKRCKDRTPQIAKKMGARVITDNGLGKGDAMRLGMEKAKYENIIFFDCDGSHEPKDIPKIIKPIIEDKADLVVASRFLGGSDELHGNWSHVARTAGSLFLQFMINLRYRQGMTDSNNGFRAIKKTIVPNLELKAVDFDIELEVVMKCLKKGYRVLEVPSHEYNRVNGKSHLSLPRMGWKFIYRLFRNF